MSKRAECFVLCSRNTNSLTTLLRLVVLFLNSFIVLCRGPVQPPRQPDLTPASLFRKHGLAFRRHDDQFVRLAA